MSPYDTHHIFEQGPLLEVWWVVVLTQVRAHQLVLPPCDVVIRAVADYVRNLLDINDLEAIAKDIFKHSQVSSPVHPSYVTKHFEELGGNSSNLFETIVHGWLVSFILAIAVKIIWNMYSVKHTLHLTASYNNWMHLGVTEVFGGKPLEYLMPVQVV